MTTPTMTAPTVNLTTERPFTGSPVSQWPARITKLIARCMRAIAAEMRRFQHRRALYAIDDRTLADMGLTRSEIAQAVRLGHPRLWRSSRLATSRIGRMFDIAQLLREMEFPATPREFGLYSADHRSEGHGRS